MPKLYNGRSPLRIHPLVMKQTGFRHKQSVSPLQVDYLYQLERARVETERDVWHIMEKYVLGKDLHHKMYGE